MGDQPVPNRQRMKINKSEAEYNMKSIRFLLLTITFMFIVIASLMIILGISVYSYYHSFSFFYSAGSGKFFTPSVLTVLLGLVMMVVWSFGFFGALKQSTCMVNTYAFLLGLVLLLKMVVVIMAFTINSSTIMSYIDIPVQEYVTDPEVEAEIDCLQLTLNCCGGNSYMDYVGMEFTGNHSTVPIARTIEEGEIMTMVVPATCCVTHGDVYCSRMRSTGCKNALVNFISQNASVLAVLGISVMFIQLLGIIFALLLARCIRKMKSERALMAWKIKEQMIIGGNAEKEQPIQSVFIDRTDSSNA